MSAEPVVAADFAEDAADADDLTLIARARANDDVAIAELYARHRPAALRYACRMADPVTAEDVVADAFTKVMLALRGGAGPTQAFRPYLLTSVRNVYVTHVRKDSRYVWVDDHDDSAVELIEREGADLHQESALIAAAFASLPERWQTVLWHTTVEDDDHTTVGKLLGIKANAVAALSYRARDGLRSAYLAAHLAEPVDADCHEMRDLLVPYSRGRLRPRQSQRVDEHVDRCSRCAGALMELSALSTNIGAVLAPALLGAAGSGYALAGASGHLGAAREFFGRLAPRTAVAAGLAIVLAGTAAAAGLALLGYGGDERNPTATDRPSSVLRASSSPATSTSTRAVTIKSPVDAVVAPPAAKAPAPEATTSATSKPQAHPTKKPRVSPPSPVVTGPPAKPQPTPPPVPVSTRTAQDLSLTGGSAAWYGDHYHLEMSVSATADPTVVTFEVAGLESATPHQDLGFPGTTCAFTGDVVTCPLATGSGVFALDVVVTGPLSATARISGSENDDPDPTNDALTFTA